MGKVNYDCGGGRSIIKKLRCIVATTEQKNLRPTKNFTQVYVYRLLLTSSLKYEILFRPIDKLCNKSAMNHHK